MEKTKRKPLISVICLYNGNQRELDEFVKAVVTQTLGYNKIQLIITGTHTVPKENLPEDAEVYDVFNGKYDALNFCFAHAEGKIVTFISSENKYSPDTLQKVFWFMTAYEDTDITAVRAEYFGTKSGRYPNNEKFGKGNRLIDLGVDFRSPLLTSDNVFYKKSALKYPVFDESLTCGGETLTLNTLLLQRRRFGVIATTAVKIRAKDVPQKLSFDYASLRKNFLIPFNNCIVKYEKIPQFFQYSAAYALMTELKTPTTFFDEEKSELLHYLMSFLDDNVVLNLKATRIEYKLYWLYVKYGKIDLTRNENGSFAVLPNSKKIKYNGNLEYQFAKIEGNNLTLEGYFSVPTCFYDTEPRLAFTCCQKEFKAEIINKASDEKTSDGGTAFKRIFFKVKIILTDALPASVNAYLTLGHKYHKFDKLTFGIFFPTSSYLNYQYYQKGKYCLRAYKSTLVVFNKNKTPIIKYLVSLWKNRTFRTHRLAVLGRLAYRFLKIFKRSKIYLISDRFDSAGDNGEAFFRYIVSARAKGIKAFFVISDKSKDYRRLKKVGSVIRAGSFLHWLTYLLCDFNISAHADQQIVFPVPTEPFRDIISEKPFVFLQHGITKNDISEIYSRYKQNTALFVTATHAETKEIQAQKYGLGENGVCPTGFPRYDLLENVPEKRITVMPTWRKYCLHRTGDVNDKWALNADFTETPFYTFYYALLTDKRLIDTALEYGYSIRFIPHELMKSSEVFFPSDIIPKRRDYREEINKTGIFITDYSSVAFDVAYLGKPVVYFQFDKEMFYASHTYGKGDFFDYTRDGFGCVTETVDDCVNEIIKIMSCGGEADIVYRRRAETYFLFRDNQNSKRLLERLISYEK